MPPVYPRPRETATLPSLHNRDMICVPCRKHHHEECPGGTWCDCQPQPPAESGTDPGAEPPLSWIRQG